MPNRWMRQATILWSYRYKNGGVLCTARTRRDGQRLQQKVQNRKLRQATVVRSCTYKKGGVLCAARTGRNGQRLQQKVPNRRLRQAAVFPGGQRKHGGVLCTARQTTTRCRNIQGERGWPTPLGKETICDVIPSCATHATINSPPKPRQPSGVRWDSRKRVLHPETTSTGSKRAAAREPSAEVVTMSAMPDTDGETSTVERNSSVKMEMQLSL